jgi:hypothetical protein
MGHAVTIGIEEVNILTHSPWQSVFLSFKNSPTSAFYKTSIGDYFIKDMLLRLETSLVII